MSASTPKMLANMDWPWKSENPGVHIILISDEQFLNLANHPDEAVEKMYPWADAPISLREYCRQAAARGAGTLRVAYDYFFGGSERGMYPDTDAFQATLKKVHDVAQEFGIGIEPSVLSPLELGVGYQAKTGESGRWMHYREGLRDPQSGEYSLMLWKQTQWCNNKGPTPVTLIGARAFAFHEQRIPHTPFFSVPPDEIVELATPTVEELPGMRADTRSHYKAVRVRVSGHGDAGIGPLDRVLVVLLYSTVELDYLSPQAAGFVNDLVQQYHDRGISLIGLYSDEMHIQQDWSYHAHMDNGQFTVRYVSPAFEAAFAERFGSQYADFARYMVYFASHQHDFLPTHEPKLPSQHVFGPTAEDIAATLLFRRNYYDFLETSVVKLMVAAREKAEALNGHSLDAYYHSTWAESPTCDSASVGGVQDEWTPAEHRRQYEYTPEFVWSNTVQQASSACANQFAWNEFLTGGNNDTAEGGYADRNYYGRALACSLAALNRRPLPSAGMWGMPPEVFERMIAVSHVFGALGHPTYRSVEDYQGRAIEVLFLYPQDLVAVEERFGSWMSQYAYANLITADKLVEYGRVTEDGQLAVKDARYETLCVLYEPFPSPALLDLMTQFVQQGGRVVWSSLPPLAGQNGDPAARSRAASLFGVQFEPVADPLGVSAPGRQVVFDGGLATVAPMTILTDFVVDRVFPVRPEEGVEVVATLRAGGASRPLVVGTIKAYPGGGKAVYLGFRPRDDQSASTGIEARTWFEVLNRLGAYPASGAFADNDNPTVIARTTGYVAARFPNGALALAPHYRDHEESWPGGFFRDEENDAAALADNPVPGDHIAVQDLHIGGQSVTYTGRHAVAWRRDDTGRLLAFAGLESTGITLDGTEYRWAAAPANIAWHPILPEQQAPGCQALYRVWCGSEGRVTVPLGLGDGQGLEVWQGALEPGNTRKRGREGSGRVGYGERPVPFAVADGALELDVDEELVGHWFYVVRNVA